jgi:uncharacterized protein YggU (UPF0235/DUF167 family)
VVELVAKEFALGKNAVVVTPGATSREKRLGLSGVDLPAATRMVDRLLAPSGPGDRR